MELVFFFKPPFQDKRLDSVKVIILFRHIFFFFFFESGNFFLQDGRTGEMWTSPPKFIVLWLSLCTANVRRCDTPKCGLNLQLTHSPRHVLQDWLFGEGKKSS